MAGHEDILLEVRNLKQYFPIGRKRVFRAVDDVSFQIRRGQTYGLVGESGSGKTTIGRAIIRIYDPTSGEVYFKGKNISGSLSKKERKALSSEMQMVFQDPMASLNPRKKVIDIIGEGLDNHHLYSSQEERTEKILQMMERVGLNRNHAYRYPHQFSGGQRQRIGIAGAFVVRPELIIADEAISALDVSVQAQTVNLMKDLQAEFGTAYLFIAHDLAMVKYISDEVGVLHRGRLLEKGSAKELFEQPLHPYTKSLLSAIPRADPLVERSRTAYAYDYETSQIDYDQGSFHTVNGTHEVLATDAEFAEWTRNIIEPNSLSFSAL